MVTLRRLLQCSSRVSLNNLNYLKHIWRDIDLCTLEVARTVVRVLQKLCKFGGLLFRYHGIYRSIFLFRTPLKGYKCSWLLYF